MRSWMIAILLCALLLPAAADPEPLYEYAATYTYWSDLSDGVYWWAVRNERADAEMTAWTVGTTHNIGSLPDTTTPEASFPLPPVSPSLPRPWFNAFLNSSEPYVIAESTIWWSDGVTATVPIYYPDNAPMSPEPSGMLALGFGVTALLAYSLRRMRQKAGL